MNKTLLITGGTGLLAVNWALSVRENYSVILGLHRRKLEIRGVKSQFVNLESVSDLVSTLEKIKPQILIHTAALTNVDKCEENPELALHVNVDLADNVACACARLDIPLVHISSDHLYAGEIPYAGEKTLINPVNVYALTKAEAESRVLDAHPESLVIRTNFYGWGTNYRHSFSDLILRALRKGNKLTLFEDVYYTPILIEILVEAIHELNNIGACGIYNVVGDERVSKHSFGMQLANEFGLDANLINHGQISDNKSLAQRPRDMSLSNKKACEKLGRKLGRVGEHLAKLKRQEKTGHAELLQSL